jgi:hypothetical protein
MIIKEESNYLKIHPLKHYPSLAGHIFLFFALFICSIISLILAIKAEWNVIYMFLIIITIIQIILFRKIIWQLKGYWKIEFDKNVITIEKNFSAFKSLKVYNLSSEDSLHLSNLKSLQFIKNFSLGKIYLEILRKIDNRNWSIVLENSEKEIINCLSENQATEILNFIKRK